MSIKLKDIEESFLSNIFNFIGFSIPDKKK